MDTASDKALQRFAELMIEKIKQVEDNWQKPWFGIKGGGLPQNIEGRTYNGVNSFMLFLLSEKEQYSLPVYMTFMQAKDSGLNILKGEKSFPVIYWNFSVRDKNGKKIPFDVYKNLDKNEQQEYKVTPFLKTYNVFNVQQTNLQETKPEKWEALKEQFKIPAIKDEQGMLTVPLIDAMVREQQWICPIYSKEGNSAYHARGEDNHIVVPLKGQFKDGENFYSTLLHEMAHSTGEPEHLNREKGVIFGDKQYAKEELVAELTSATVGQSLGISTYIREENAMYLKNWLGALKEDPKFIYNILADVGKASNMIQEHASRMEQYLTPEERFTLAVLQDNRPVLEQMNFQGAARTSFFLSGSSVKSLFSSGNLERSAVNENIYNNVWMSTNTPEQNANVLYPRLSNSSGGAGASNNTQTSTWWQRNGSFIRLKNMEIGYTLPKSLTSKTFIKSFRFYVSGSNLLTFAPFDMWDPEKGGGEGSGYPLNRVITIGFNANF